MWGSIYVSSLYVKMIAVLARALYYMTFHSIINAICIDYAENYQIQPVR